MRLSPRPSRSINFALVPRDRAKDRRTVLTKSLNMKRIYIYIFGGGVGGGKGG